MPVIRAHRLQYQLQFHSTTLKSKQDHQVNQSCTDLYSQRHCRKNSRMKRVDKRNTMDNLSFLLLCNMNILISSLFFTWSGRINDDVLPQLPIISFFLKTTTCFFIISVWCGVERLLRNLQTKGFNDPRVQNSSYVCFIEGIGWLFVRLSGGFFLGK